MAWYTDPTQVPAAPTSEQGDWQYSYKRKPTGKWGVKRQWEGAVPRDIPWHQAPAWSWNVRELPSSWSPTASQFPWQTTQGITSDPQRQAAFNLGLGGGRPQRTARKAYGTYFDPETGFSKPEGTAVRSTGTLRPRTSGAQPGFAQLPQPTTMSYPWMGMGATDMYDRNYFGQMAQRIRGLQGVRNMMWR